MLDKFFSDGLALLAFVTPISIAATNIVFFPILAVWLLGWKQAHTRWPAVWGTPEKMFLVFLGISVLSAVAGLDPRHSLREIKNKDFYLLWAIVIVALVRDPAQNAKLLRLFMIAGLITAIFGILQYAIGIDQDDKSNGAFLVLPAFAAHWPRRIQDFLTMLQGRVMGTRGHPLAYAECLLFNWGFAVCFMLTSRGRAALHWLLYMTVIGAALLLSQSRGPWIAGAIMLAIAIVTPLSRRAWPIFGMVAVLLAILVANPVLRHRAESIRDRSHRSNKERLHMWQAGTVLWRSHPLLGIGPGNVKAVSADFQTPDEHVWGEWGHLHSTYVNFLAERGALGLLAFLVFVGALWQELFLAWRQSSDPYASTVFKATLLGLVGYLIGGLTETSYNTAVVSMTLYFVVGLALALSRHGQSAKA